MKINKLIILIGFMIITFTYNIINSYALETTIIYRNANLTTTGFLYTTDSSISGTINNGSLNTVYADPSYGISFFINKGTVPGKVYKIRINFNDYDYLKSNTFNVVEISNGDNCSVVGYQLINQGGSNNQAKGVDITYTCINAGSYTGISLGEYIDGTGYKRITTINWRINNVQWEQVDDNDAEQIIANASINTQNIINNNNENTQDIINNQNSIAEQQEKNQQVCETTTYDISSIKDDDKYLTSSGSLGNQSGYGVSDYIDISNVNSINVLTIGANNVCYYNSSKSYISCFVPSSTGSITSPTNASFMRITFNKSNNRPIIEIDTCKNGNQAINDTLTDDNVGGATSEAGDFITGFDTNTFGLTSIITAPLNLIQSLTSSSCSQLELPLPYLNNKKLILPCMTSIYQSTFGSLFTMYQTITFGIIAYWVCVRIFNMVKDFKNPDHDEVEVVDL